jgi:hypothetical protein
MSLNPIAAADQSKLATDQKAATLTDPKLQGSSLYQARGGAATFDLNAYKIEQHSYPSDLMSPIGEYGGNYVIFYINVAVDSKLLKDPSVQTVNDATPRDVGDAAATSNKYQSGAAGVVAGQTGVALAGLAVSGNLTSQTSGSSYTSTGISSAAYKTLGAAAVGAGMLASVASTFSGQKKRLATAIALHTPNNMSTTYSVSYDEEDTDTFAMGLAAVGEISPAFKKAAEQKGMSDVSGSIAAAVISQGLKLPGSAGEQIFKHVNFRTFTFDYQFYPRDAKEAENVLNIIYQFKLHMHPEFKDANNFLYIYPSEFDIFYYNGGKENLNVNRHTSCVLTDMVVNYSPNGQFTSFANGMPTQINVTLTFKELATLTKEKIQDYM